MAALGERGAVRRVRADAMEKILSDDERTCDSSMTLPRALVPAGTSRLLCVVHTTEMLHPHVGAMETSATMASLSPCPPAAKAAAAAKTTIAVMEQPGLMMYVHPESAAGRQSTVVST